MTRHERAVNQIQRTKGSMLKPKLVSSKKWEDFAGAVRLFQKAQRYSERGMGLSISIMLIINFPTNKRRSIL